MLTTEVTVRKWGNSLGVILPKELVEEENLKEGKIIHIRVLKPANLSSLFGSMKTGMTGQEFKDMVRAGWEKKSTSSTHMRSSNS
ncbi:MAG: AbrB/MazE/SpoVT family DNA-binding domain-containing protein [Candidatus Woesearchaeota archaeon]